MNIFTAIGQFFTNWGAKLASTFLEDDRYMMLVEGLRNTAIITLGALCIGIVIGALVAIIKYCGEGNPAMKPLCVLCDIYTTVIRGIPVVVLLLIFYFVIMKSASGVSGGIAVGIVTFGINSGAYLAELMRSGIGAVVAGHVPHPDHHPRDPAPGHEEYPARHRQRDDRSFERDRRGRLRGRAGSDESGQPDPQQHL